MNSVHFILSSLSHYRRIHVAVGLGVAVATAVLTGALLVGNSVRGSLRDLTLARLGRIDEALVTGPMFRAELATELMENAGVAQNFSAAEPAILTSGTLQTGSGDKLRRATQISVIGCPSEFWSLGEGGPSQQLTDGEMAITAAVAEELNAKVGDTVLLRVPAVGAIPSDSALGRKDVDKTTKRRQFKVASILPSGGLARFALRPSQHLPRNVFLPLVSLQDLLEKPSKANAILVAGHDVTTSSNDAQHDALQAALRPRLIDYGLQLDGVDAPAKYARLSSEQLVLRNEVVATAETTLAGETVQPVVTYLANTISIGEGDAKKKIPYSTITGVDSVAGIGPVLDDSGQPIKLKDDEIVLNRWAADDLGAKPGDQVSITFYEPESENGKLVEHAGVTFKLKAIVELKGPDGQPTPAADPKLTPELPGVTDQASIADWDTPFELVETVRRVDEDYWHEYRTTPKAFVSLVTAKRLWGSRWGTISLMRMPAKNVEPAALADDFAARLQRALRPEYLGLTFLPVKRQGLAAASGTTPFDALFLGFSFFLIAAAIMLIALLFQLGVVERASELGILGAVGIGRKQVTRLLVREALVVATIGAAVGVVCGIVYAWLMIYGLRTWWVAAVATPFLELHITPQSLAIGWLMGVVVTWLTIRWSIRRLVRLPAAQLLAGQTEGEQGVKNAAPRVGVRAHLVRCSRWVCWPVVRIGLVLLIVALGVGGFWLRDEAQAGAFFGSGAAVLTLLLGEIRYWLRSRRGSGEARGGLTLAGLSALNTARHPGRSVLTIGLVASASFLIIAMSAFRLETSDAGSGGFELIATSDQPITHDLNTAAGRAEQNGQFTDAEQLALENWQIYSFRMKTGEDASCLNLYKPAQPTVLGVSQAMIDRGGFEWGAVAEGRGGRGQGAGSKVFESASTRAANAGDNPWWLLDADLEKDANGRPIIPVVLDANTAMYSLQIGGVGARLNIMDDADLPITLEVVGLLKNSILQGKLLVSEANFTQMYPETNGFRFFLLGPYVQFDPKGKVAATPSTEVARILESRLADEGFDATVASEQLAEFLAVQNTYLSTFQSLGALGLLLGTIGLAVVQLRSVLERRGELALMRASGFRRSRLVWMVLWENAVLLLGGLVVGCIAAAVALVPQWGPHAAGVPWRTLVALLGSIAIVGLVAGWLATRSALRAPIVPALRGD